MLLLVTYYTEVGFQSMLGYDARVAKLTLNTRNRIQLVGQLNRIPKIIGSC